MAERAYSVTDLIVALAMIAILGAMAVPDFKTFSEPLPDAKTELLVHLKMVRAKAIEKKTPYSIFPGNESTLRVITNAVCGGAATGSDTTLDFILPKGVKFAHTNWALCYTSKGIPTVNLVIELVDNEGLTTTIEQFLGIGEMVQ